MAAIIAPSILTADFGNLREEVQNVVAGGCKLLHLDIMDDCRLPKSMLDCVENHLHNLLSDLTMDLDREIR